MLVVRNAFLALLFLAFLHISLFPSLAHIPASASRRKAGTLCSSLRHLCLPVSPEPSPAAKLASTSRWGQAE